MNDLFDKIKNLDLQPLILSFKISILTTIILLIIGIPVAYFLANKKFKGKSFIESIILLPLVLPSTVLGFYLIWLFSNQSFIGKFLNNIGIHLLFTFQGLVVASIIYSFPFMVNPIKNAIENFDKNLIYAAYTLGKSKTITFFKIVLPNIKNSIITAMVTTFAHTMGEFGVVLMVGGNIPGKTQVASIAVYDYIENLDYEMAHIYSAILLLFSLLTLFIVYFVQNRNKKSSFNQI